MSARERNRAAGRIGRPVTALAVAILFLGTTWPVLAAEKIGSTSLVIRRVTGEMEEKLRLLSLRDDVHRDELITTATESASRIRFVDGTELELGPEAQLKLDRFVYDDDPARGQFILSAARGVFRFISGKLAKEAYAVNTPTVTIGVRGTTFACIVGKDGTTAVILESEDGVVVRHRSGEQLTLRELGLAIVAYPDGRLTEPGPPPDWAVERLKQLDALLGFRPVRVERDRDERPLPENLTPPPPPEFVQPQLSLPAATPVRNSPPPPPERHRALERAEAVASDKGRLRGLSNAFPNADVRAEGEKSHGNKNDDGGGSASGSGNSSGTASTSGDGSGADGTVSASGSGSGKGGDGKGKGQNKGKDKVR